MLIILPINVLAVVYSSALYGKYAEKNRADHTLQTAAFADDLSYEMARISQALTYYFSTDSFGRILVNPTQDPSVLAVSCKNIISHIQDQNSAGFGYAWDHTNDILYIFGTTHITAVPYRRRSKVGYGSTRVPCPLHKHRKYARSINMFSLA